MKNKSVCIIVTYNRLNLLKRCIQALRNQTLKNFDIIAINNGSTDGTKEWLESQDDIEVITQDNYGGSGGFHNGMVIAYEQGYERFWIMDDDGEPTNDCFEILSSYMDKGLQYVAPNLITFDGKSHFPQYSNNKLGIVNHCGGPFNGILISRKIVETVGVPNAKFFIWGDEYEYVNRIRNAGFFLGMALDAIHHHKDTGIQGLPKSRIMIRVRNEIWKNRLNENVSRTEIAGSYALILHWILKDLKKFRFDRILKTIKGVRIGRSTDINNLKKYGEIHHYKGV